MKIVLEQTQLLDLLQSVQGPTTTKQNFPILNCVLIEASNNRIKFTSSDLDTTIIADFQTDKIYSEGSVAVPAKRFIPIIRELPKKEVTIELLKNNLLIRCEKIAFKINVMDYQEFPKIKDGKDKTLIKVNSRELLEMITLTSFCVGFEESNYVLNGILFQLYEDSLTLVSTDGKRLACISKKLPDTQPEISEKIKFIFPVKSVAELARLLKESGEEIFIFSDNHSVGFDLKDILFIARPIEGEFPDYSQYIPDPIENKLIIDRKEFLATLKRAELLSTPDYLGVKVSLKKDEVMVYKATPQLGEVKETVIAEYKGGGLDIGFNPTYLIDVLKNIEEEKVGFDIYGVDKPAVLRMEDYIYLILPMKL